MFNQALGMFTEARLRKDSGAAVPETEVVRDRKLFGVMPGDSPEMIAQKRKSRYDTAKALAIEAGPAALQEHFGDNWQEIISSMGNTGGGGGGEAPPGVVEALSAKGPGRYKLSDGTSWVKNTDGSITGVR